MTTNGITLRNMVTGEVLELDKITTEAYILESVFWSEIQGTHHSYKYIVQTGESVTNTTLETRDFDIVGWIVAGSESSMTERKRLLNRFFNPQQPVLLVYSDFNITIRPNTTVSYSENTVENNDVVCKFKMTLYANDPLWRANDGFLDVSATTLSRFHFPLVLPNPVDAPNYNTFGVRRSNYFVYVTNSGDMPTGMQIKFTAESQVLNPRLVNVSTMEFFGLKMTLRAGESVTVDTNVGQRQLRGVYNGVEENYFKYRDFGSTWLTVDKGVTRFKLEADNNVDGLDVEVRQYGRFLEVQECI